VQWGRFLLPLLTSMLSALQSLIKILVVVKMLVLSPEYFKCLSHNRQSEKAERKQDVRFWKKKVKGSGHTY